MLIAAVREEVREACRSEANVFGPSFFEEHLEVVADCSRRLAECLNADVEVVELAAYLHDYSAVLDAGTMATHARASAELAVRRLTRLGYPQAGASRVAEAIALHSEPLKSGSASPEAVCVSNADAAARMLRPAYWLYFAFTVRKLGFEEGRQWLRGLIERQWTALISPARDLAGSQCRKAMELLRKS
jgi:HD superfamily phosphodiesterase